MVQVLKHSLLMLMGAFLWVSCAHHKDVRTGDDGLYYVTVRDTDRGDGVVEAKSQANTFCTQRNQTPTIVEDHTARTALHSNPVAFLGFGHGSGPFSIGVGKEMGLAQTYQTDLSFRCE